MQDFKPLIKLIAETIDKFNSKIPAIQQRVLDKLRFELRSLDLKGDNIAISSANVKKIAAIKAKLQEIILNPEYVKEVKQYIKTFEKITQLQNQYFNAIVKDFTPPKVVNEIKNQAIDSVVENLTERGLAANVLKGIEDILLKNITSGGSYQSLMTALENNLTDNETGDGQINRYTKQITTDAVNQYSRQYTQIISSDLGYEWFVYAGSNLTTTRPFCLACVKKRYIHISEFPALLEGEFREFEEFDGKLYKGLPSGMYPDTTVSNLQVNAGGYNCGHQFRPVDEGQVPTAIRNSVYNSAAYAVWAAAHGKTVKEVPLTAKEQRKNVSDDLAAKHAQSELKLKGFDKEMSVTKSGIDHSIRRSKKGVSFSDKMKALNNLDKLFKKAKYSRFEAENKNRSEVKGVHIFKARYKKQDFELIFRETNDGIKFYDIRVM